MNLQGFISSFSRLTYSQQGFLPNNTIIVIKIALLLYFFTEHYHVCPVGFPESKKNQPTNKPTKYFNTPFLQTLKSNVSHFLNASCSCSSIFLHTFYILQAQLLEEFKVIQKEHFEHHGFDSKHRPYCTLSFCRQTLQILPPLHSKSALDESWTLCCIFGQFIVLLTFLKLLSHTQSTQS